MRSLNDLGIVTFFHHVGPNLGPLVARNTYQIVVSDHYLENYSLNPLQILCVY